MCISKASSQGDISTAWRQVKMTFKLAPGKVNYEAKENCPINVVCAENGAIIGG
jgi:hypothetical protein